MKRNLFFLGNDGSLLREVLKLRQINLVGVAADRPSAAENKYFGSSFSIGKRLGVPVISQADFNDDSIRSPESIIKDIDIILMHGYHYRIKSGLLRNRKTKIINFHQSLLPQYGGRHPLNWAIIKGEKITGVTFHYVNDEFDMGDIILQKKIRISKNDDALSLYNKTIKVASEYLRVVLKSTYNNSFMPIRQDLLRRTYFVPRTPEDGIILKSDTAKDIRNKIRALVFPYPGAFVYFNGRKIIIDGAKKIQDRREYKNIEFVGRCGADLILRAQDALFKVTKIRK